MATLGQKLIRNLKEFIAHAKAGKPFEQTVMRRMKVKGKTVWTREIFVAPLVDQKTRKKEER